MRVYIYFIIFILVASCASNNEVYWCGDHACANNKEKVAYFKKTMIVEVRSLDKKIIEPLSTNQKILNESKSDEKNTVINVEESIQEINLENEIEKEIELQIQDRAKKQEELNEHVRLDQDEKIRLEKKSHNPSSFDKVAEINEIETKDFDEIVEKILLRNSSRSYPKINDISK